MISKNIVIAFTLFCYVIIHSNAEDHFVTIKIHNGTIRGIKETTIFAKKEYIAFRGIPYAKPPLGNLRFLPPMKADNWTGILDTTRFRSTCTQIEFLQTVVTGSEDCLFVNVYVPVTNSNETLPVMFYTHGGAFYEGSGETRLHGPDFLLEKDVIVVTCNFRLSIFGFLSLGDDIYSGNMGLKDQLLALKWANENIQFFNGDAKRITIFGHSSGATMIHMATISPATKGLFQRAISLGASAINRFSINKKSHRESVFKFAKSQRNIDNYDDVIHFLQTCDSETLLRSIQSDEPDVPGRRALKLYYAPTIESANAISPYLTDYPENLLDLEKTRDIDIMFGITEYEMLFFSYPYYENPALLESFNEKFEIYMPINGFDLDYDAPMYREVAKEIRDFYFGINGTININSFIQYVNLVSDITFTYGIHKSAVNSVYHVTGKTYYFRFMVDAQLNVLKQMFGFVNFRGTSHGDELGYLFKCDRYSNEFLTSLATDSVERKTIDRLTTLISNFAKFGDPTPNDIPIKWPPVTQEKQNYLEINNDGMRTDENPNLRTNTFWNNLFEKYRKYSQPLVSPNSKLKVEL